MPICRICHLTVAADFVASLHGPNSEIHEANLCAMCFRLIVLKEDSVIEAIRKVIAS